MTIHTFAPEFPEAGMIVDARCGHNLKNLKTKDEKDLYYLYYFFIGY
jgi:hypothetical protein